MNSIISIALAMVAVEAATHDDSLKGYAPSHDAYHDIGYNPWEHVYADTGADTAEWYSPYQQYAPAKKAYKPFPQDKTLYAICWKSATQFIELAQVPGKAIQARFTWPLAPAAEAAFKIWSYFEPAYDVTKMGDEVNYMTEFDKYGRKSHYQDPARGIIGNIVCEEAADCTDEYPIETVLLNLAGPESIMGRPIKSYSVTAVTGVLVPLDADCTIQHQQAPELPVNNVHHHHRGAHKTNDHYRNNHQQATYGYNAGNQYGGHRVGQHGANPNGGFSSYSPRSNQW